MAAQHNFLADINPVKETWKIKVRIIRLWKLPDFHNSEETNSIEMILMDEKGSKIQATAKRSLIKKFANILKEGGCYSISNFGIGQNGGTVLATKHAYKLDFHMFTSIRACELLQIPIHGFDFASFEDIISNKLESKILVDVIGEVVAIGKIEISERNEKQTKRITLELEDIEKKRLRCTLWEQFAEQLLNYVEKGHSGPIIMILQLGKINIWRGNISISNSLFSSRLLINANIQDVENFKKRILSDGKSSKHGISELSSQTQSSSLDDFSSPSDYKFLNELRDIEKECHCVVLADVVCIETQYNWFYLACKKCNKKVKEDDGKFWCQKCTLFVKLIVARFKVHIRVMDSTSSASFVLFDSEVFQLLGKSATDLKEMLDKAGESGSFPEELNVLLDKKFLFKIGINKYNLQHNWSSYTVLNLSADKHLINSFNSITSSKKGYTGENDSYEGSDCDKSTKEIEKESNSSICENEVGTESLSTPVKKRSADDIEDSRNQEDAIDSQLSTSKKKIKVKIEKDDS